MSSFRTDQAHELRDYRHAPNNRAERDPQDHRSTIRPLINAVDNEFECEPKQHYGQPTRKSRINWFDFTALTGSLLCLATAIVVVRSRFAGQLGYANQIIALGFILGVMHQCLQRVLPYLFLLLESRYGDSTLQNYEGLLRWSPLTSRLSNLWRTMLVALTILPLGLSVLYKQYSGAVATIHAPPSRQVFSMVAPPGLQDNIGPNAIMANLTTPFLSASKDDVALPKAYPQYYGFNLMLLSNESAAALDGPLPSHVTSLQQSLQPQQTLRLTADVRGTVVRYNRMAESLRQTNDNYWDRVYAHVQWSTYMLYNGWCLGLLQKSLASTDEAGEWDDSYTVVGASRCNVGGNNADAITDAYEKSSLRFDARRHACRGVWHISRQSIELVSGDCADEPLQPKYQFYMDAQLGVVDYVVGMLKETLSPFITKRNTSHWTVPTHAAVVASAFQSIGVNGQGTINIQINGSIWQAWNVPNGGSFTEIYESEEAIERQTPIIDARWSLYIVLALQPFITVLTYISVALMYSAPLGRNFGVVSLLAGVNRHTLDLLQGAGLSGELSKPVKLQIKVLAAPSATEDEDEAAAVTDVEKVRGDRAKIEYVINEIGGGKRGGTDAKVRTRTTYE